MALKAGVLSVLPLKLQEVEVPAAGHVTLVLSVDGQDVARWGGPAMLMGMGAIPHPRSSRATGPPTPPAWFHEFASRQQGSYDPSSRRLHWLGYWDPATGYGQMSHRTVAGLIGRGWEIAVHRMPWDTHQYPAGATDGAAVPPGWSDGLVACCLPTDLWRAPLVPWTACWTMWEAHGLRPWWREILRAVDEVWVPSQWCAERLAAEKASAESIVVPVPIDVDAFAGLARQPCHGEPIRFLFHSSAIKRKGLDVLCRAWSRAFPTGDEPVRLDILARYQAGIFGCVDVMKAIEDLVSRDARVDARCDAIEDAELLDHYRLAHCAVLPTRGEGFGMTVAQSMAAGHLVIAPSHTGLGAMVGAATALVLRDAGLSQAGGYYDGTAWLEPDEDHLVELLRQAAADPAAWKRVGAAQSIVAGFSTEHAVDAVEERLLASVLAG